MFIGEYICFGIWRVKQNYVTSQEVGKTNIHPAWLAIPAGLDLVASTLTFISLTMIDASVYQMLRGLIVVVVPILSMIFLGTK